MHTITRVTKKSLWKCGRLKGLNIDIPTSEFNWHQLLAFYSSTTLLLKGQFVQEG